MVSRRTHAAEFTLLCFLVLLSILLVSSCSSPEPPYRVAVIGFEQSQLSEERNSLVEYGERRVEAELGAEVDLFRPGSGGNLEDLFSPGEEAYDLVISMGQNSSQEMLSARPADTQIAAAALDYESGQPVQGENAVSLVRYAVEEGAYICGYLAAWLSSRNDHPLTNARPNVAFIGATDDPLQSYYDNGFSKGARAAVSNPGIFRYLVTNGEDYPNARAYAEHAVSNGVDIFFCSPGLFNAEVLEVAREKNLLVILVGADRSNESPENVLTSLILRDDNALFEAVSEAMNGDLKPGRLVWGNKNDIWTLAPFYGHDTYIRKELKEALQRQEEELSRINFSS